MDFEEVLKVVDAAVVVKTERHLKDVEVAILRGSWQGSITRLRKRIFVRLITQSKILANSHRTLRRQSSSSKARCCCYSRLT